MVVRCQESLSPRLDGFGLEGSEGSPRLSRRNLDSPGVRPVGLDDLDRLSSHEPHGCHHETSRRRETFSFKEFGDALGEFFSSLKLAIFLMITLAILSTVGTVIQQGERPEVYIKED